MLCLIMHTMITEGEPLFPSFDHHLYDQQDLLPAVYQHVLLGFANFLVVHVEILDVYSYA
jgi:hypothetical protein